MHEDALALTVSLPEQPTDEAMAAELWRAVNRLRNTGFGIGTLRNLVLGMIHRQASGETSERSLASTPQLAELELREITRELGIRGISVAESEHLAPETAIHLLYLVQEMVETFGAAEAFRIVLDRTTGARGNHVTPRSVVAAMVNSVGIPCDGGIYDPASRAGELLACAADVVRSESGPASLRFRASSPTAEFAELTRMNLAVRAVNIDVDVAGPDGLLSSYAPKFSRIITNPPFNQRWTAQYDLPWRYGVPPASNANYAWLQGVAQRLAPNGRAAVLMTHAAASSSREKEIRAGMVEDGCIEALIKLPAKLFPGTGIGVTIWLLKAPGSPGDSVLFIDASDTGFQLNRAQRSLGNAELQKILAPLVRWRAGGSLNSAASVVAASKQRIRRNDYDLNPLLYLDSAINTPGAEYPPEDRLRRGLAQLGQDQRTVNESYRAVVTEAHGGWGAHGRSSPEEWTLVSLGDISRITPGATTKDGPSGTVSVVKPKNVVEGRLTGATDFVDADEAQRRSSYRIEPGDILCTRTGTVGRFAVASAAEAGWIFGTGLIRIRTLPDADPPVDPHFLSLYLAHPAIRRWLARYSTGSAIQSISAGRLRDLPVRLPSMRDQRSIAQSASVLDDMRAAHENAQRTAAELGAALRESLIPVYKWD